MTDSLDINRSFNNFARSITKCQFISGYTAAPNVIKMKCANTRRQQAAFIIIILIILLDCPILIDKNRWDYPLYISRITKVYDELISMNIVLPDGADRDAVFHAHHLSLHNEPKSSFRILHYTKDKS